MLNSGITNKWDKSFKYLNLLSVIFVLSTFVLSAQWMPLSSSPEGGSVSNIEYLNGHLFANAYPSGIYSSTDEGKTWERKNYKNDPLRFAVTMNSKDNNLFIALQDGTVWKSSDNGEIWSRIHEGKNKAGNSFSVNQIKIIGNNIYLCTTDGLFRSTDDGENWTELRSIPLNNNFTDVEELVGLLLTVNQFADNQSNIFLNNYISSDNGENWSSFIIQNPNFKIYKVFSIGVHLYVCIEDIQQTDFIYNIFELNSSLVLSPYRTELFKDIRIIAFESLNDNIALNTLSLKDDKYNYRIFHSINSGNDWRGVFDTTVARPVNIINQFEYFNQIPNAGLAVTDNFIYAGTSNDGVLKIDLSNLNYSFLQKNIYNLTSLSLQVNADDFYVSTLRDGIYHSVNGGNSWEHLTNSPKLNNEFYKPVFKTAVLSNTLYAATQAGLYKSVDKGQNWSGPEFAENQIIDVKVNSGKVYAIGNGQNGNLFISSDNGQTWSTKQLPALTGVRGFTVDNDAVYLISTKGILKSVNEGNTWNPSFNSLSVSGRILPIIKSGTNIIAGSDDGIYISENNGQTWQKSSSGIKGKYINALNSFGQYAFCSTDSGAYISTTNGKDWYEINNEIGNLPVNSYDFRQNEVYALMSNDEIYKTNMADLSKIKIENLQKTLYCAGNDILIEYTVNPQIEFQINNTFLAQLSDETGRFTSQSPIIGQINSQNSGIIPAKIPDNVEFGTGYRIRVISTYPALTGIDNLTNIILLQRSNPDITGENSVCSNQIYNYSVAQNAGYSYKWLAANGEIQGADNSGTVSVKWLNQGTANIKIVLFNSEDCADSSEISIIVNPVPEKPVITFTDNILESNYENNNQWYFNGEILTGETSKTFTPVNEGFYSVKTKNDFGCESDFSETYLFEQNEGRLVLNIDNSQANSGEEVNINIRLEKNLKYYSSDVKSIQATLVFNSSVLYPLWDDKGVIIDGKRYVQIEIDTAYISQDIVKVMNFLAMLGDSDTSEVTLENVRINGLPIDFARVNAGNFRLLDICYEGGPRLITSVPLPLINGISPNPSDEQIKVSIETFEDGNVEIYMLNTLGMKEAHKFSGNLNAGKHEILFSLKSLSIGEHYFVLESGGKQVMSKFIISR